ncbi:MAG: hypothetical protein Kow0098_06790 [Ignavibacteriaceae bacterium]
MKRELKKKIKRERIIEAASDLFSKKNYHEVMMDDVAKMISVAKGTLYNYFPSKEDLYFSIMKMRMDNLILSLKEKISSTTNSIDSLNTFVIHLYMFMMKYKNFFLMFQKESFGGANQMCSELRNMEEEIYSLLTGIIRTGKKQSLFRNIDEELAVKLIIGSIYGAVKRGIDLGIGPEIRKTERNNLFEYVLFGLFSGQSGFSSLPLKNKTIVLSRAVDQSEQSANLFKVLGADVIVFPTLEIVPPTDWKQFDEVVKKFNRINFVVFTSVHAVEMFSRRCAELNVRPDFSNVKVVAVGNKTASACKERDIPVDIIPEKFSSEGVIKALEIYDVRNKVIFIPRSAIGREELPAVLEQRGAVIKPVPVYNVTIPPYERTKAYIEKLKESDPDLFVFTSPSTFDNFIKILNINDAREFFRNFVVAAIGPTTKKAIEKKGVKVNILPEEFTLDGLIKAITDFYRK